MPVVAKMPTWLARLRPGIPTWKSTTVSPLRRWPTGRSPIRLARNAKSSGVGDTTRENWVGRLFGLRNTVLGGAWRRRRGQVAEAPALGQPVGPLGLLVQRVGPAFAPGVVGEQGAGNPLRPAGLAVLGAVADVDDPEQVAPAGRLVHADEQLAEEQVLVGGGPEESLQHIAPEEPSPRAAGSTLRASATCCPPATLGDGLLAEGPSSMPLSIALTSVPSARGGRRRLAPGRPRASRRRRGRSAARPRPLRAPSPGRRPGGRRPRAGRGSPGNRRRRRGRTAARGAEPRRRRPGGRCGTRTGRRGRAGPRRRASPARPRGGALRQAPTSRRGPKSRLCLELQLADERGPAPGERTVLGDAHQGHIAFCRPGEQVGEPVGRDPPVRLEVPVHQHDRPGLRLLDTRATRRHSDQSRSRLRSTGAPGAVGAPISDSERLPSSPPPLPVRTWTAMSPTSSRVQRPPCQRVRAARVAATCRQRASATKAWPPSTAQQSGGASRRTRGRSSVVAKNSRSLPFGSDSSPAPPEQQLGEPLSSFRDRGHGQACYARCLPLECRRSRAGRGTTNPPARGTGRVCGAHAAHQHPGQVVPSELGPQRGAKSDGRV